MQRKQIFWILLAGFFARVIFYSIVVPVWEFPDEQAHYSQIAYYMEQGIRQPGFDVSAETLAWQQALGTVRDERGINNYTYNPSYRPMYSDSSYGPGEEALRSLPRSSRQELVKSEAAWYPPLYYRLISPAYGIFSSFALPERIVSLRILSSSMYFLMGLLVFFSGKRLFRDRWWAVVLVGWIWFHPMLAFVMHGINNDALVNLTATGAIALLIYQLKDGPTRLTSLGISLCLGLAIVTKPLGIPLAVAVVSVVLMEWLVRRRPLKDQWQSWRWSLVVLFGLGGSYLAFKAYQAGGIPFIAQVHPDNPLKDLSLVDYLKTQVPQHYRQTLVWYWGVYKWLGVVLPLWLIRALKVAMAISIVGLGLRFWRRPSERLLISGLVLVSVVYVASLSLWDYDMIRRVGFSHGLQGRYFFPTILAHMSLLVLGWKHWLEKLPFSPQLLLGSAVVTWMVSIHTLLKSYYDLSDLSQLLLQLSQYKPLILKPPFQIWWLMIIGFGLVLLIYGLLLLARGYTRVQDQSR